ncbi:hypothetical protein CHS0354_032673 [Potamilus streckersoni]|uniref:Calcium-responsive transcription factor n=1 Tax=Potamilus streckersoni TaxID=2493646 RepID=A0AAE0TF91_9BIVA|nr:hypothetical protein CHS0354_032673 [Potamilus streckersoni]
MSDSDDVSSSADAVATSSVNLVTPVNADDLTFVSPGVGVKADDEDDQEIPSSSILQSLSVSGGQTLTGPFQSLLATPISISNGQILAHPESIQIITVSAPSDLGFSQSDGRVWQVVNPEMAIIAVGESGEFDQKPLIATDVETIEDQDHVVTSRDIEGQDTVTSILMPPSLQPLPPNCPPWAARLRNCERLGDYFRGYVESEVELDLLLTYHKQQTQSFWGTRQSPSPAKPSTRLMWKSQYVPWDGIPFVNSGSRAVVMECQFGPRRKGALGKKLEDIPVKGDYRQTCPARIYIKKVRKFPDFAVDMDLDKKSLKNAMDKAFHELKQHGLDSIGQERFYVQLPTENAHEFHVDGGKIQPAPVKIDPEEKCTRLHPRVVQRIRDLVAAGEVRVYAVRKQLRNFVIREMGQGGLLPQRHDLTLFPTVNDLKNQIHQALKDVENGTLPLTAPTVNVEIMAPSPPCMADSSTQEPSPIVENAEQTIWPQQAVGVSHDGSVVTPVPETVTVTLTQNPGEDGSHVISRIETHLSDGTTHISNSLTPETAQLLVRLNPAIFPPGTLVQLQGTASTQTDAEPESSHVSNNSNIDDHPIKLEQTGTEDIDQNMDVSLEETEDKSNNTMEENESLQILNTGSSAETEKHIMTDENDINPANVMDSSTHIISCTNDDLSDVRSEDSDSPMIHTTSDMTVVVEDTNQLINTDVMHEDGEMVSLVESASDAEL